MIKQSEPAASPPNDLRISPEGQPIAIAAYDGAKGVAQSIRILISSNKPLYGRLCDAMMPFLVATTLSSQWPEALAARADQLEHDFEQAEADGTLSSVAEKLALDMLAIHEDLVGAG